MALCRLKYWTSHLTKAEDTAENLNIFSVFESRSFEGLQIKFTRGKASDYNFLALLAK